MGKWISLFGLVFVLLGTLLTLWSIINTKVEDVGTWDELAHRQENFKKEKNKVIWGISLIILGNILQGIGLFF